MDGHFGYALDVSGDVDGDGFPDLIAGVPYDDVTSLGWQLAGSVRVHAGRSGALLYHLDGPAPYAHMGWSVAAVGDVDADGHDDFLAGAPVADPAGLGDSGSALLYSGATGALLRRHDGLAQGDKLGWSVAKAGDVDGDGIPDYLLGAPDADPGGLPNAGSVFLHSGATGQLLRRWDGSQGGEYLGTSLAGGADLDGDGRPEVIAGAPSARPGGRYGAGSVLVFSGASGAVLHRFDGQADDVHLGASVAVAGDVDGDGVPDVVAGARGPLWATGVGSAFVYSGSSGRQIHQLLDPGADKHLGIAVATAGDVDGDGHADLLVGADSYALLAIPVAGSASLFSGRSGTLLHRFEGQPGDSLGAAVAGGEDRNGDGRPELCLGSPGRDVNGHHDVGAVLVYDFNPILQVDVAALSAAAGGRVRFDLDFPDGETGASYALLASWAGTDPWKVPGGCIPLTFDALTRRMIQAPPPLFHDTQGVLGPGGSAQAWLDAPPGWLASYTGRRTWFAAVSYDPAVGLRVASVPVPVDVVP